MGGARVAGERPFMPQRPCGKGTARIALARRGRVPRPLEPPRRRVAGGMPGGQRGGAPLSRRSVQCGRMKSGICQAVFPKMFNCSEPLKLRTGALPLRFATPGYFQNMNRGRNVAEFDSNAPTVQGGIPMTVNVNREGSACVQGPFAIQSWARRACPGSATGFRRACSPVRGH